MTREQQIDLSRQELVNTLSAGIWFENLLNQSLLRTLIHEDPTSPSTHYKLTELGDETRHMVMFGKAIERIGAKPVPPAVLHRMIINALPLVFQRGSTLWLAALIGEEIFDSLQRQMMDDPELQPMVQRLMRIHVTEEARHIQFARDGARKRAQRCRAQQVVHGQRQRARRVLLPLPVHIPIPYARVGLDPQRAREFARSSAHRHEIHKPASPRWRRF